jgi:hypothetical protein
MLASPYIADHRAEVEKLCDALSEIEEIVDLWHAAQTNWLFFLKIFEEPEMHRKLGECSTKFKDIHIEFTVNISLTPYAV